MFSISLIETCTGFGKKIHNMHKNLLHKCACKMICHNCNITNNFLVKQIVVNIYWNEQFVHTMIKPSLFIKQHKRVKKTDTLVY